MWLNLAMLILFNPSAVVFKCVVLKGSPDNLAFLSKKENWLVAANVAVAAAIVVVEFLLICISASNNNRLKAAICLAVPKSVCMLNCSLCLTATDPATH